jgi:uncharacterized membrane protein
MILGGFGAPLFLFLAGVAVPLSAGAKSRRLNDDRPAARAVEARGLQIFGLAFLFRLQAWILGGSAPSRLLKVDILNIMGPSIVAAAAIWGAMRTARTRILAFTVAALATTLLTPLVRTAPILDVLPDPIEAYLRPAGGFSSFTFFPWAGFLFAGAMVGLAFALGAPAERAPRLNYGFIAAGSTVAILAYAGSYLPSVYAHSEFWSSSPAFFLLRAGLLVAAVGLSYVWVAVRPAMWSPLEQLGRTSLFIYWIHVEMVYGLVSLRIHQTLSLGEAWVAYAVFCAFLILCSIGKDRFVGWWRRRHVGDVGPAGGSARSDVGFEAQ